MNNVNFFSIKQGWDKFTFRRTLIADHLDLWNSLKDTSAVPLESQNISYYGTEGVDVKRLEYWGQGYAEVDVNQ